MLRVEWDPAKSDDNFARREFDFAFAALVFTSRYVEYVDTRRAYGEKRLVALGLADGIPLTVVFTDRMELTGQSSVVSSAQGSRAERSADVMPRKSKPRRKTTPSQGRADLTRLRRVTDREIERTAPVELQGLSKNFWRGARVVNPVAKQAISLRLDSDVIEWFRASGSRYQTRMNAVLRTYVDEMQRQARGQR